MSLRRRRRSQRRRRQRRIVSTKILFKFQIGQMLSTFFVFPMVRSTTILSQCPSCASNFELCISTCRFAFSISVLSFRIAFRIAYFRCLFRTCKRGRLAAQEVHEARFTKHDSKAEKVQKGKGNKGPSTHSRKTMSMKLIIPVGREFLKPLISGMYKCRIDIITTEKKIQRNISVREIISAH